jgi:hypothetical protein
MIGEGVTDEGEADDDTTGASPETLWRDVGFEAAEWDSWVVEVGTLPTIGT